MEALIIACSAALVLGSACKGWAKIERAKHGVR